MRFIQKGPAGENENGEPFDFEFGMVEGSVPEGSTEEEAWNLLVPEGMDASDILGAVIVITNPDGSRTASPLDSAKAQDVEGAAGMQAYLDGEVSSPFEAILIGRLEAGETHWQGTPIATILEYFQREAEPRELCSAAWQLEYYSFTNVARYLAEQAERSDDPSVMVATTLALGLLGKVMTQIERLKPEGLEPISPHDFHNIIEAAKGYVCPHATSKTNPVKDLLTRPEVEAKNVRPKDTRTAEPDFDLDGPEGLNDLDPF
jgi:hypothetical protein